jgi:hypothetical protein
VACGVGHNCCGAAIGLGVHGVAGAACGTCHGCRDGGMSGGWDAGRPGSKLDPGLLRTGTCIPGSASVSGICQNGSCIACPAAAGSAAGSGSGSFGQILSQSITPLALFGGDLGACLAWGCWLRASGCGLRASVRPAGSSLASLHSALFGSTFSMGPPWFLSPLAQPSSRPPSRTPLSSQVTAKSPWSGGSSPTLRAQAASARLHDFSAYGSRPVPGFRCSRWYRHHRSCFCLWLGPVPQIPSPRGIHGSFVPLLLLAHLAFSFVFFIIGSNLLGGWCRHVRLRCCRHFLLRGWGHILRIIGRRHFLGLGCLYVLSQDLLTLYGTSGSSAWRRIVV